MPLSFTPGVSQVVGTASQLSGAVVDPATATQGGTGLTSVAAGYIPMGNGSTPMTSVPYSSRLIAYATALSLTASGDVALTMSGAASLGSYAIRRVTLGMPNAGTFATAVVVATLRTASGGGGSAITGALVVTGLSATTAFLDQTVTLASGVSTASQLYVNVTTGAGGTPVSQIFVYADSMSV